MSILKTNCPNCNHAVLYNLDNNNQYKKIRKNYTIALIEMEKALQKLHALEQMKDVDEWGPYAKSKAILHVQYISENKLRMEVNNNLIALKNAILPIIEYYKNLEIVDEDEIDDDEIIIGSTFSGVTKRQFDDLISLIEKIDI